MLGAQSSSLYLTPSPQSRGSRKVWCECRLPLHRGARHQVTNQQKKRHRIACLEQHIPFTDSEAEIAEASIDQGSVQDSDESSSDMDLSSSNGTQDLSNTNNGPDEDDRPNISDWIQDVTTDRQWFEPSTCRPSMQGLEMFDAFIGTPREKLKKMRHALKTHYEIDIGDPTRTGHSVLDDTIGDVVQPQYWECCANGCAAYTGRLIVATVCPTCGTKRYNHDGQPRYTFQYIPLIPRLRLQYSHPIRSTELSSYRATFDPSQRDDGSRSDIFDGCWFRECWKDGFFHDHRDLAMRLTLDAIGLVKNPKKRQTITPVVVYILNLHPNIRDHASNALTTHLIPGGFDRDYTDTWLQPLMNELHQLRQGIDAYDGASRHDFLMRAHVILVTGDGPAIADVTGTKSPGKAKQSCRMCIFSGTLGRNRKYFYPHGQNVVTSVNIDLRDHIEEIQNLQTNGTSKKDFDDLKRDLGINYRSILVELPTLHFPRSFPIDTMHSMNHNIPKSMFHLWKGSKYQRKGQDVEKYPWVIPNSDWVLIDRSVAASRATVPTYVGTAPRGTSSFANWTTHEWRSFFLTYGAPAMYHFLPKQYATNFLRYRQLLNYTSQHSFTSTDVMDIQARTQIFIQEYEDLYYGGDPDLLPSCTIQFHYLLHLRQNILDFGPPACYAQWSLERFLRTMKSFATSTLYKHRSVEVNALLREQRLHTRWSDTALDKDHNSAYAIDTLPNLKHQLVRQTNRCMEPRWQRELRRVDDPLAPWHAGTAPEDMIMYHNLTLPTGIKVGTFSSRLQSVTSRSNAFVMFYTDVPAPSYSAKQRLSFGTVVTLFMDPADLSQWAGVVRYQRVGPVRSHHLPRPRTFDEGDNDIIWVSVDRIVDLIGVAQVFDRQGMSISRSLFLVDKHGYSET